MAPTLRHEFEGTVITLKGRPVDYSPLDDHCRRVPRWFRALNTKVLQPVHAVYPSPAVRVH